jgi:tRNA(Ile)-lysidine synthase TilS/MesJ
VIRTHSNRAAYAEGPLVRPLAPVPDSAVLLLATVRRLYGALQCAAPAERPFLEREIRVYADRYRACVREDLTPCSN